MTAHHHAADTLRSISRLPPACGLIKTPNTLKDFRARPPYPFITNHSVRLLFLKKYEFRDLSLAISGLLAQNC